jgi:hypothetical protein
MSSFRIENHSHDTVDVAVAYNHYNGDLIAEGWWTVGPNRVQTFAAPDAADLHLRVQSRAGDDLTFGNFNSFLWWTIPQARFSLGREAGNNAVQVLRWGANLERTLTRAAGQPFPDGWSRQRFFQVGPGDHTGRIDPPTAEPGPERYAGVVRQILAQQHLAQVERFHLDKLEDECKRDRDSIGRLRLPMTPGDLQRVIDFLQARSRYLDAYQPLLRELTQAGHTALALYVSQEQNDLRSAIGTYTQMYHDAVREQARRQVIQQEANQEATRLLMESAAVQARRFEETWQEAELMRRGSPEWAAKLIARLSR